MVRVRQLLQSGVSAATGATARTGAVSLFDQAVVSGTNFLASVIVARAVSRGEFGLYELGFTIVTLLLNIQTSLVTTPFTVYSPRLGREGQPEYAGSTLIHLLGLSVLAAALLAGAWLALGAGVGPVEMRPIVAALTLVVVLLLAREYVRRICFAYLRMKMALLVDCCAMVLQIGGLLALTAAGLLSAKRAYLVAGLAAGLAALAGFTVTRKLFVPRLNRAAPDLARNWSLGKWTFAAALASMASAELYPWFLAAFRSYEAAGVLGACSRVVFLANPLLMGMMNFVAPKAAHAYAGGRRQLDRLVTQATAVVSAAMIAFAVLILVLGAWLLELMYDGKYAGYEWVVMVLALRHVVGGLNMPVNCGLLAIERADIIFKSYIAGIAVTFGLGVPLVHAHGVQGAAWALVASAAATAAYRHWCFWIYTRREPPTDGRGDV